MDIAAERVVKGGVVEGGVVEGVVTDRRKHYYHQTHSLITKKQLGILEVWLDGRHLCKE